MESKEVVDGKRQIDAMSQKDMARMWRFTPAGHPFFITGTPLADYFKEKFKGFTPELSKRIGW